MSRKKINRGYRLRAATAPMMEALEQRTLLSISGASLYASYLVKNATFNFTLTDSAMAGSLQYNYTVIGATTAPDGQSASELDVQVSSAEVTALDQIYLGLTTSGIVDYQEVSTNTQSDGTVSDTQTDTFSPPELEMPAILTGGQNVNNTTTDTNNDGGDDSTDTEYQTFELVSESPQSITVPAGTFNAYEVTYTETDDDGIPDDETTYTDELWLAPNVGLVETYTADASGEGTDTLALDSYSVPEDSLKFVAQPTNTLAGNTIAPVSLEFVDQNGNVDTNATGAVTLVLGGGTGTLGGTATVDANDGVATFSNLSVNVPGNYTLDASSTSAVSDLLSNTFQITGDHLVFTTQPTGSAPNTQIPLTVSVDDPNNTVDTTANGTIDLTLNTISGGDGAVLGGTVSADIVDGVAKFTTTAGPAINADGVYTFTATQNGTDSPATNATSDQFSVSNSLTWTGNDGSSWSDPKNWAQDEAPMSGDSLLFPDGAPLTSNNDISGLSLTSIDIQGSGYTLGGDAISLTGGLTSESGNNTYDIATTLVGSPTIDDQTGDLTIGAVLSGANLTIEGAGISTFDDTDTYTGTTTLMAGVTIDDSTADDAFGDGALTIGAGSGAVSIDDTGSGSAELDNDLTFQAGATLDTDPNVVLTGDITVNGQNKLDPVGDTDTMALQGANIQGNGTLTIAGAGVVTLSGDVAETVQIQVSSGMLSLSGNLLSLDNQVTVNGGTLALVSGMSGTGGIDLQTGTLTDEGEAGYSGNITLERAASGPDVVQVSAQVDPLGTGTLVIATPTSSTNPLMPTLTNAAPLGLAVKLSNAIDFKNSSELDISGAIDLGGVMIVDGDSAYVVGGAVGTTINMTGGIQGVGKLIDNMDGTLAVSGDVAVGVTLQAQDPTGVLALGTNLLALATAANQVVDIGGTVQLLSTLSGNAGIDIQSGTLAAGALPSYGGNITVETPSDTGVSTTVMVTPDANDFGNAPLIFLAAPKTVSSIPQIVNTSSTSPLNFTDPIQLQGVSIGIQGPMTFAGPVTVTGSNTISADTSASVSFTNTMSGTGTLTMSMNTNTATIGGVIAPTVVIQAASGTVNLDANLEGIVGGANQIVLTGGTVNMMADVSGNGGVDVQSGTLAVSALPNYAGNISVETPDTAGVTTEVLVTPASNALGNAQLIFAAAPESPTSSPQLADASLAVFLTLDNPVVFQRASVTVQGVTTFAGSVTVTGHNTLVNQNGAPLSFTGGMTGTGTLETSLTTNTVSLSGTIASGVVFDLDGTTPELDLSATLQGAAGTTFGQGQIVVDAGTVKLLSGFQGTGAIDLVSGTLASASSVGSYSGNIIIDQEMNVQDVINATPGTSVLGTGQLIVANPSGPSSIYPLLTNTQGNSQTLVLDNTLVYQSGFHLQTQGSITFSNPITTGVGDDYIQTMSGSDVLNFAGGVQGTGTLNLYGTGSAILSGTSTAGIAMPDEPQTSGGSLTSMTLGNAVLNGGVNEITVSVGTLVLEGFGSTLGPITGSGGINMLGGTLSTDKSGIYTGDSDYSGTITISAGAVATDYDIADIHPFGIGTLTLNGGTLQNSANATPGALSGVYNPIVSTSNSTIAGGVNRFKLEQPLKIASGTLSFSGDVAVLGGLSGAGNITMTNSTDTLEVAGSNPGYTGQVVTPGGTIEVTQDDALGAKVTGNGVFNFFFGTVSVNRQSNSQSAIISVNTIADPIIENPIEVQGGILLLEGLLTFPGGIVVDAGATLEIAGAGSQIVSSGALSGGGTIIIESGTFSTPGGTTGFTGTIQQTSGLITPMLAVSDTGGVANGSPYPATATLSAPGVPASSSLEGVSSTFTYFAGSSTMGVGTSTAPSASGTYTVVGAFAGSTDYAPTTSTPVTFIITSGSVGQNQAPTVSVPPSQTLTEYGSLTFSGSNGISVADTDSGGNTEQLTLTATNGVLKLASTAGLTFIGGTANGHATIEVDGTLAHLNAALNGLVYTPTSGYFGSASLTVGIDDLGNTGGAALSSSAGIALTVNPVAATKFVVSAPSSATAGTAIPFTVTAEDAAGQTANGYSGTVKFSSSDGAGLLPASAQLTNGVGTFSVTLKTAGKQTITATDTSKPSIKGTSGSINVLAAQASDKLVFLIPSSNSVAGWLGPVVVLIENSKGQIVTGNNSTVTLSVSSGPGMLRGDLSVKAFHGVAIFWNLYLTTAGTYTLQATDGNDTSAVSHTFHIYPAAPEKLVFAQGPTSTGAGDKFGAVVVDVEDQYGNLETGFNSFVTLSLNRDSRDGTLLGTTRVRAVNGVATFSNLWIDVAGTYRLEASGSPFFSGVSNSFTVSREPA